MYQFGDSVFQSGSICFTTNQSTSSAIMVRISGENCGSVNMIFTLLLLRVEISVAICCALGSCPSNDFIAHLY